MPRKKRKKYKCNPLATIRRQSENKKRKEKKQMRHISPNRNVPLQEMRKVKNTSHCFPATVIDLGL